MNNLNDYSFVKTRADERVENQLVFAAVTVSTGLHQEKKHSESVRKSSTYAS
jgi:hypothetical protein